jgi:hypothetical protein
VYPDAVIVDKVVDAVVDKVVDAGDARAILDIGFRW